MDVDDLLCMGDDPDELLRPLGKRFKMGPIDELTAEKTTPYCGMDVRWDVCELGQKKDAEAMDMKGLDEKDLKAGFSEKDLALSKPDEHDMSLQKEQQAWVGVLGWMAKTHAAVTAPSLCGFLRGQPKQHQAKPGDSTCSQEGVRVCT